MIAVVKDKEGLCNTLLGRTEMTYTGKNGTYVIQCKMLIRSEFDMVVYKDQISLQDEAILKELLSPEEKKMVVRAVARHFKLAKVKVLFK